MKWFRVVCVSAVVCVSGTLATGDGISDAFDALKRAEAAHDPAGIARWAVETSRLTRAEAALPPSQDPARADYLKDRALYITQTDVYTEYSMAVAAGWPGIDPSAVVQLTEILIARKPDSAYLGLAVPPYLAALGKLGASRQAEGAAMIMSLQPDNEDALLVLMDEAVRKQEPAGPLYAQQLINAVTNKAKPQQYDDAGWQQKKKVLLGRAHFNLGVAACTKQTWADCDSHMRVAQPLVASDPALAAPAWFYLGWSNYQIAKASGGASAARGLMEEALKFTQQAAAVSGPVQEQARQNAVAMEQELKRR